MTLWCVFLRQRRALVAACTGCLIVWLNRMTGVKKNIVAGGDPRVIWPYGAQYLHHKDNDLYRWAAEANLLGTTTGTGKLVAHVSRQRALPESVADVFATLANISQSAVNRWAHAYPHATQSIGAQSGCRNVVL